MVGPPSTLQYLGSLMGLLTLTVILFTQVMVISSAGINNLNGTYEYDNTQFVCNSNSSFTITSFIEPTASPSNSSNPTDCKSRPHPLPRRRAGRR